MDGAAHASRPRIRHAATAADAATRSLNAALTEVATETWDAVSVSGNVPVAARQRRYATI